MCQALTDLLCQYKSVRFINVKNKKLATVYYLLITLVLAYIIGYTIIYEKGYQVTDDVTGVTSVRIKGSGAILSSDNTTLIPLDSMDLRNPPHELDAVFITTSMTVTPNQTQSYCNGPSDGSIPRCTKQDPSNCTQSIFTSSSQGLYTGECGGNHHCELYTWCPLEDDSNVDIVQNVGNFSLFVKILGSFDRFNVKVTNIYDINGDGQPVYGYNLFTVNDILSRATDGVITDYIDIADSGAILMVSSVWNCNFDHSVEDCQPEFRFKRVGGQSNVISSGFNFHSVSYDVTNTYRLLKKLHGLRIMFVTEGTGKKFNLAALSVTMGAGLAYLGLAKFITDLVLDYFYHKYSEFRYENIDDADDDGMDTNYHEMI